MSQQERLILFRGNYLACNQVALVSPAASEVRLQKAQGFGCVARMNGSQHMFAIDAQRSSGIAKRRNRPRRALAHGWFSATSVCVLAGDLRSASRIRFTR
jgi:hypothetical protein